MRYSIEPKDRIYVKGYGFLSFAKNMNDEYSQKNIDTPEKTYNRCNKNYFEESDSKNSRSKW